MKKENRSQIAALRQKSVVPSSLVFLRSVRRVPLQEVRNRIARNQPGPHRIRCAKQDCVLVSVLQLGFFFWPHTKTGPTEKINCPKTSGLSLALKKQKSADSIVGSVRSLLRPTSSTPSSTTWTTASSSAAWATTAATSRAGRTFGLLPGLVLGLRGVVDEKRI